MGRGLVGAIVVALVLVGTAQASQPVMTLDIPSIQLHLVVVEDNGQLVPGSQPVHYAGTALPGEGWTVAIAAHHATHGQPFGRLPELRSDDAAYLTLVGKYGRGTFLYRRTGKRTYWCDGLYTCPAAKAGFGSSAMMALDRLLLTTCDEQGKVRIFEYFYRAKR